MIAPGSRIYLAARRSWRGCRSGAVSSRLLAGHAPDVLAGLDVRALERWRRSG
jgi:hypothetical protein